ncbi:GNAT family N-acetyltransferase [Vibrio sp. TH_r3]|uniref:GNAT family N-acetyltransferase n=1 Tax=Vibrio sp. TH_r3 TaxID=3082084 RepID=UPI002954C96E|nr:GNAT family N-acetyltransferase [Vibrio sp. TH_r3]MDV7106400.1 GNAT family N-acetyltransferase [Vibrio sp. TH_r3]
MQITISRLDPQMIPLVQKLYKQHYKSSKAKKDELIFVARCDQEICGVVRLKTIGHYRLLTGMLVIPKYRRLGIAHLLLQHCTKVTLNSSDYCFAYYNLEAFYQQHNFTLTPKEQLPEPLKNLFLRYSASGKSLSAMHYCCFD